MGGQAGTAQPSPWPSSALAGTFTVPGGLRADLPTDLYTGPHLLPDGDLDNSNTVNLPDY